MKFILRVEQIFSKQREEFNICSVMVNQRSFLCYEIQ